MLKIISAKLPFSATSIDFLKPKHDLDRQRSDVFALPLFDLTAKAYKTPQNGYQPTIPFQTSISEFMSATAACPAGVNLGQLMHMAGALADSREIVVFSLSIILKRDAIQAFLKRHNAESLMDSFSTERAGYMRLNSELTIEKIQSATESLAPESRREIERAFTSWINGQHQVYRTDLQGTNKTTVNLNYLATLVNSEPETADENSPVWFTSLDWWVHNHPLQLDHLSAATKLEGAYFSAEKKSGREIKLSADGIVRVKWKVTDLDTVKQLSRLAILVSPDGLSFVDPKRTKKTSDTELRRVIQRNLIRYIRSWLYNHHITQEGQPLSKSDAVIRLTWLATKLSRWIMGETTVDAMRDYATQAGFDFPGLNDLNENTDGRAFFKIPDYFREQIFMQENLVPVFTSRSKLNRLDRQTEGRLSHMQPPEFVDFLWERSGVKRKNYPED